MTAHAGGAGPLARLRRAAGRWRRRSLRALRAARRAGSGRSLGAIEAVRSALAGNAQVTGWAYCPGDLVEAVVVLVDGEARAVARLGESRPDVAAAFGGAPGSGRSGWSTMLELPDRAGGRIAVSALVVTSDGLVERLGVVEHIVSGDVGRVGDIERPVAGSEVPAGQVTVEGWALPTDRLTRIEVGLDGRAAGLARPLAVPRPDLHASRSFVAPLAGFVHTLDVSDRKIGDRLRITCEIVTRRGKRTTLGPVEVVVGPDPPAAKIPRQVETLRAEVAEACARPPTASTAAIRLLVVTHRLDLGGGQLYVFELLQRLLIELDISCLVVAAHDGPLRSKLEILGASVHVCGDFPAASPEHYEMMLRDLAVLARDHGCNVAMINTMGAALGADLAGRLGVPAVWAIHESYPLEEYWVAAYGRDGVHPYVRDHLTAALGRTAAVVFEAHATRQQYAHHGDPRRFITVPYGITVADVDKYREATRQNDLRAAADIPDDANVLLCMGTYEPRKAQGALVTAFAEVADEFPDALLVLVGDTGGPYAEGVREVVRRLALGDRVRLIPVVEDSYRWYAMADVFISASDIESLPRSVLEAMAFHVPVLAASVFGLPELIEDGITGMLFSPRDLDALVEGLRRALEAPPEELAKQADAAAELIRTRYDAAGYAGAFRTLLRGLLADPDALPEELLSA